MKSDKIFLSISFLLVITVFLWIISCTHNADITNIPEVCFERDVLPVFQNSCAISGCHDGQGESHLSLTNYVDISHSVVPGKPFSSPVYKSIIATWGENSMPPGQPLSMENRILIRLWIEQGASLTTCQDQTGQAGGGGSGGSSSPVNPLACFARDIQPVLLSKCATTGCHDALSHAGGYVYSSYTSTILTVSPGKPLNSKLYQVIKSSSGEDKMPPSGRPQLTAPEIDSIGKWIGYGALNQSCGETCDTLSAVTFSGVIWPAIQSSCTGCHSGASPSGSVSLTSYATVSAAAANGTLMNSLRGTGVPRSMPPGNPFSVCRIRQFDIWVKNGYLNN
jgi:hypothetical protein